MTTLSPDKDGLCVIYEDEEVLAVDKPSGLLSQPGKTVNDSVVTRVREARPMARGSLLVHRLDMDTSGVLLLAKSSRGHAALQQQFERREVRKRYRAVIVNEPDGAGGLIDLPLRLDVDRRPYQIVCHTSGRRARTAWKRVGAHPLGTEILFFPLTGRTHQLRVHAADSQGLGAAVRGDRLYGEEAERLFLHAERLLVTHPASGQPLEIQAPCPFAQSGAGIEHGQSVGK